MRVLDTLISTIDEPKEEAAMEQVPVKIRLVWRDTPVGVLTLEDDSLEPFLDVAFINLSPGTSPETNRFVRRAFALRFVIVRFNATPQIDLSAPKFGAQRGTGRSYCAGVEVPVPRPMVTLNVVSPYPYTVGRDSFRLSAHVELPRSFLIEFDGPLLSGRIGSHQTGRVELQFDHFGLWLDDLCRFVHFTQSSVSVSFLFNKGSEEFGSAVLRLSSRANEDENSSVHSYEIYLTVNGDLDFLREQMSESWSRLFQDILGIQPNESREMWPAPTASARTPIERSYRTESFFVREMNLPAHGDERTPLPAGVFGSVNPGVPEVVASEQPTAVTLGSPAATAGIRRWVSRIFEPTPAHRLLTTGDLAASAGQSPGHDEQLGRLSMALPSGVPPWTTAYRPSWVLPRRQSSIYIYVFVPETSVLVRKEAHAGLDEVGNPARETQAIPLSRALQAGEPLVASIHLPDFDVGEVEPVHWHPPYVRFVVSIRAHVGIEPGVHRPLVTVRTAAGSKEILATFDFAVEVRASSPRISMLRGVLTGSGMAMAIASLVATEQAYIRPALGISVGVACVAGGAGAFAMLRPVIGRAEIRDRSRVFISFAPVDRERVKRAICLLQALYQFPHVDTEQLLAESQGLDAVEHAERFVLFWSRHTSASTQVTSEWRCALEQVSRRNSESRFIMSVMLDHERPTIGHPLSLFASIDLGSLADVLIVTAVKEEYEAVLGVETGAVEESTWVRRIGPTRIEVAFREFTTNGGSVLRIAVTQALGMGGVNAVTASQELIQQCGIRCLAMCGVCAGRRGDVELGDVIIADRLWQYDTGKRKVEIGADGARKVHDQGDIDMYKIQPSEWVHAAERFQLDEEAAWLASRPRSYAAQGDWILERIFHKENPASDPERKTMCADYTKALNRLWKKGLLKDGLLELTDAGITHINRLLTLHCNQLPKPDALKVHVGPIASGNKVIEDEDTFPLLAGSVRKILGVEMEAAAIGALSHARQLQYSVVIKAVMDHADPDKSDNFKKFAARASAECLIAFLRKNLPPRVPPVP